MTIRESGGERTASRLAIQHRAVNEEKIQRHQAKVASAKALHEETLRGPAKLPAEERAAAAPSSPEGGGRDGWDVVTARAVAPLRVLLELALPLATPQGWLLAIKGQKAAQEIDEARTALRLLKAAVDQTHRTATGTIVVVRRDGPMAKRFPRRPGEPGRAPLGAEA